VALIDTASVELERVVRQLPAEAWTRPTPSEMSVAELVAHVVSGNRLTALLLSGVDRDEARARLAGDQLGDDLVAAVVESAAWQARAFKTASPDQPVPGPRGDDVPASTFLLFRLIDLVVHAWDVRRGAGLDETLDPEVVSALWTLVEPRLDELHSYGAYGEGPSGALSSEATTQARLLDALGRRP
jgi:uncharacterized protein (TIGR03086 family)